jgi:adenylate cyclase
MSAVLHSHSALINKFMGDGIFAFFNPPIFPCEQHARRACEAAIDAQRALDDLIARQRGSPLAHVFERLRMRIGVASGPVYVGDYGSENKLDYTCMGDTVNLAARLETANKAFGTAVMVSGPTHDAAGDGFAFRRLGALQVIGKQIAVPVYELLGREPDVSAEALAYAERFAAAVALFQARHWEEALTAFAALQEHRPTELAAARYMQAAGLYRVTPPPDDWNGAIELTEK